MQDLVSATAALSVDGAAAPGGAGGGPLVEDLDGQPVEWVDVLPAVDAAADSLRLGELLSGDCFNMHEAMSALELMDPQMDTGLVASDGGEKPPPPPPPPRERMPPAQMIALLDEVLCGEVGWYSGLPLSLTVFRLDWLHALDETTDPALKAALLATARTAAAVRALVLRADVCDEEDFLPSCFGLPMHEEATEAEVVAALVKAEEETHAAIKRAKAAPADAAPPDAPDAGEASASGSAPTSSAETCALLDGVACRLRLRRALLAVMSGLTKPGVKALEALRRMLAFAEAQLPAVRASLGLGCALAELGCFSGAGSRSALGSAPQRKVTLPTREAALDELATLLRGLREAACANEIATYDALIGWLRGAVGGRTESDVVVRSYTELAGLADGRASLALHPPLGPIVWAAVAEMTAVPADTWQRLEKLEPCQTLLAQLANATHALLRLSCLNRARERRRLRRFLTDWSGLQELADEVDMQLQQLRQIEPTLIPFGSWVLAQTLGAMRRFLTLGFELDLYAPCEYRMVYWYIEYVCGVRLQLHAAAQQGARQQAEAAAAAAAARKGSNKKKPKPAKAPIVGSPACRADLVLTSAIGESCRGLTYLLSYLDRIGVLPRCDHEFTPLDARYSARFAAFGNLYRPRVLLVHNYVEAIVDAHGALPPTDLLAHAAASFRAAKATADRALQATSPAPSAAQRAELSAIARAAVTNGVAIATEERHVAKATGDEPKPEVAYGLSAHPFLLTVGLRRAQSKSYG